MKVLFITSAYPTHRDDARGIFIHRLARELCRQGIQVTVIAPGAPSALSSETVDGVEVYRAKYWCSARAVWNMRLKAFQNVGRGSSDDVTSNIRVECHD